ncbi:DUF647-domain-containing protein [Teratosphaeria destructans]|uniref:DUF647-domain-containing protein n=1 Tax=Teratosphaeria destructans TaxID=418781 RepID=A0A9W7SK27_9PEZI|nr:DUF647-domain-containing protein [Teratosphaeria destructans]
MAKERLEIAESDEAGNIITTYISSPSDQAGVSRIDLILPKDTKSLWQTTLDCFLPVGYPQSVTDDYLEYQIYDSLQAFSSSIVSILSSRAVLSTVGVGDAEASPTAALMLSILQDCAGRIATILFAHRFGTAFEPECKMYRLLADVLNDTSFVLNCLTPVFPKSIQFVALSFSSVLRSLCGVAAGSAKASLSAHFAKWGNLAELNAKDSSQETVISLVGMMFGSLVVSYIVTPIATWTALVLLLSVHLETNRRAVRAVKMRTLNRQRATLVYHQLTKHERIPTPFEISRQERIFEYDGVLRSADDKIMGHCHVGGSIKRLLSSTTPKSAEHAPSSKLSLRVDNVVLNDLLQRTQGRKYILGRLPGRHQYEIILKEGVKPEDILEAWWQALASAEGIDKPDAFAQQLLQKHRDALVAACWDLDIGALETRPSVRVRI